MLSFTFTGHVVGPIDATLPTFTFDATVPVPFIDATFVTGSYAAIVDSVQLSIGNEVVTPGDPNQTDGYGLIQIVDRDVSGSFRSPGLTDRH